MLRSTDLLALPAVDCDKAFAMQLTLEDTLMTTQTVYFQVALLYPLIDLLNFLTIMFQPCIV
jgi:protein transport protein SEC24